MNDPIFRDPSVDDDNRRLIDAATQRLDRLETGFSRINDVITLCQLVRNVDTIEANAKRLAQLESDIAAAQERLVAQAEKETRLREQKVALDQWERAIKLRDAEHNLKVKDASETLRKSYLNLIEIDDAIKRRILRYSGMLDGFSPTLQSLPEWPAIERAIGAPVDVIEEMREAPTENIREGFGADKFSEQSTLTRSMPAMASHDQEPTPRPPDASRAARRGSRRTAARRAAL